MILNLIKKIFLILIVFFIVLYSILWMLSSKKYEVKYGISFSHEYAQYLGLDPREVYESILSDLKPDLLRLAVPWSEVERVRGVYDFSNIDYFISRSQKANAKVILVVGQKVPRWPECYIPEWTKTLTKEEHQKAVLEYVEVTVERYKNNSAIEYWQIENEPFIRFPFGECELFDKEVVHDEVELVKKLDPSREVVITDSGEMSTWRRSSFLGDVLGTTLYRTTRTFGGLIFSYDWLPPAFYKLKARLWGNTEQNFFVSELQAEPWFVDGTTPQTADYSLEKTFSPERFAQNIEYSQKVGASRVYLWGAEWWYFMKAKKADTRYWDYAKELFDKK
jgi:hypothetical protein